jgi:hypothetical protein
MLTDNIPEWLASRVAFEGLYATIPECTKHGLRAWVLHAQRPGQFVEAVLMNDMYTAMDRADVDNLAALQTIMTWVKWECPTDAWLCPSRTMAVQGPDAEREDMSFRDMARKQLYTFKGYMPKGDLS